MKHADGTHYVEITGTATDELSLAKGLLLVRVDLTALWDSALDITNGKSGHVYLVEKGVG